MKKFSRFGFGIGTRLAFGFTALCLGTLVAAGAGWFGIERQSTLASRVVEQDVEFALAVANIRVGVLVMRNSEKDLVANVTSPAAAKKYWEQWSEARGRVDELVSQAALVASSDAERAGLDRLSSSILKYDGGMQMLHVDIEERKIAIPEQGYQRIAEFMPAIQDTESAATELLAGVDQRIAALTPALQANTRQVVLTLGAVTVLVVLLAALTAVLISRSVSVPVAHAVRAAEALARGDLTVKLSSRSDDEIGRLMQALRGMVEQLASIVGRIKQTSELVGSASRELVQGNSDLSSRTEEQASALEEASASMQQMTATVSQNAANARQASELASSASAIASRGGQAMGTVVGTMTGISESSKKIADIIGVIDGIAFQTNILALNAAVEAARAGEQGRGFAVVAAEVRSLAQRSAQASKEIRGLIADAVSRTESGSKQVQAAGSTIGEMVEAVKKVAGLVGEITAASQEQAQGIEQVSSTMSQLEKVTQQNAAMVEQASAAAGSLEQQSKSLVDAVSVFKLEAEHAPAAAALETPAAQPVVAAQKPAERKNVLQVAKSLLHSVAAKAVPAKGSPRLEGGWQKF
jgi:methyl-accepting chemotaxis protein